MHHRRDNTVFRLIGILGFTFALAGTAVPGLAQDAADTVDTHPVVDLNPVRPFLERTLRADRDELSNVAQSIPVSQLPFLAAAMARSDHPLSDTDDAYSAMVRWHLWMSGRFDPTNTGFWRADPQWFPSGEGATRTGSLMPSLELLFLRSLAVMATRRGYAFDAQVWWRDWTLLRGRIAARLYDPVRGGYAAFDESGRRMPREGDMGDLIPVALDAPYVRQLTGDLAETVILGSDAASLDESARRTRALTSLDPMSGWASSAELRLLAVDQSVSLLHSAVSKLGRPDLTELTERTLRTSGLLSDNMTLRLGSFTLPAPTNLAAEPFDRSASALEFLVALHFLRPSERDEFLALGRAARGNGPDDMAADALLQRLTAWRNDDFDQRRALLRPVDSVSVHANGAGSRPAFNYRDEDAKVWAVVAFERLMEDVMDLRLKVRDDAPYRVRVSPSAVSPGAAPQILLRFRYERDAREAQQGRWTAVWSDGRNLAGAPRTLSVSAEGPTQLTAKLPAPPAEPGIWHLILRGPAGAPAAAPSVAVAEPFEVALEGLPREFGSRATTYSVALISRSAQPLSGRFELVCPNSWSVSPSRDQIFDLSAGGQQSYAVTITPPPTLAPGRYPFRWRFYDGAKMVSEIHADLTVHLRWLRIGPFQPHERDPLGNSHPPDLYVDASGRYPGVGKTVGWEHLPGEGIGSDGSVTVVDSGVTPGVYYALAALTTRTKQALVELKAEAPAMMRINGEALGALEYHRRSLSTDVRLTTGTNYVLIKVVSDGEQPARFQLTINDIDGQPLQQVSTNLEELIDGYAYVGGRADPTEASLQRSNWRIVPLAYNDPAAQSVAVVGSFNGWSPTATIMQRDSAGDWRADIRLEPGRFEYKFAVDGTRWVPDPKNPRAAPDGFGGKNSVLVIQ